MSKYLRIISETLYKEWYNGNTHFVLSKKVSPRGIFWLRQSMEEINRIIRLKFYDKI